MYTCIYNIIESIRLNCFCHQNTISYRLKCTDTGRRLILLSGAYVGCSYAPAHHRHAVGIGIEITVWVGGCACVCVCMSDSNYTTTIDIIIKSVTMHIKINDVM